MKLHKAFGRFYPSSKTCHACGALNDALAWRTEAGVVSAVLVMIAVSMPHGTSVPKARSEYLSRRGALRESTLVEPV